MKRFFKRAANEEGPSTVNAEKPINQTTPKRTRSSLSMPEKGIGLLATIVHPFKVIWWVMSLPLRFVYQKISHLFQNDSGIMKIYTLSSILLFAIIFIIIPLIIYSVNGDIVKYFSRFTDLKVLLAILSLVFMGVPAVISEYKKNTIFKETMSNADDAGMEHAREKEQKIVNDAQIFYTQTLPLVIFIFSLIDTLLYIIISFLSHSLFSFLLEKENFWGVVALFSLIIFAQFLFVYVQHKILGRKNTTKVVKIGLGRYEIKSVTPADGVRTTIIQ